MHRKLLTLLFHKNFITENLFPYVIIAIIFVNLHRTEDIHSHKLTPIPSLLYKIAPTKLIPLGTLRTSPGKLVSGIDKSMLFRTISMQTLRETSFWS